MAPPDRTHTLSIRLLRKAFRRESAFGPSFTQGTPKALARLPWPHAEGAEVFAGQIYSKEPDWTDLIGEVAGFPNDLNASGAGAVIFIPAGARQFALCFGHVHLTLDNDAFERQFGLKVTLNSVPRNRLRSLDLATPDAVTFQKRVQASKDSDVNSFGVDMSRDLARIAGGTPANTAFAKFVAGKDSLSITCSTNIEKLKDKCKEILEVFESDTYKKDFSWIDNLKPVEEASVIADLDSKIFAALSDLRKGKSNDLHMAPPEIVDYQEGSTLHYNGFGSKGAGFNCLSIDDYAAELNRTGFTGTIEDIKSSHRIAAKKPGTKHISEKWKTYDCFTFEVEDKADDGKTALSFVLFSGIWYLVDKKFKTSIERYYDSVKKITIVGPTTCRNEEDLIEHLKATRADLLVLDQEKINPSDVRYANLEPCDFLSDRKQFIHLKDGHSSGPISHLWAQGIVSAEAFASDAEFRKKLRSKVKSKGPAFASLLPKSTIKPLREEYQIVFGIMRKPYADRSLGLPFFSKVSLKTAAERITQLGFPLAIELIEKP